MAYPSVSSKSRRKTRPSAPRLPSSGKLARRRKTDEPFLSRELRIFVDLAEMADEPLVALAQGRYGNGLIAGGEHVRDLGPAEAAVVAQDEQHLLLAIEALADALDVP